MTETSKSDEFTYRRVHSAPRDLVFECMTTAAHLSHFWGPEGTHSPVEDIVVELTIGGAFETTMVNDLDGSTYRTRAVYTEVDPPTTLSWREVESGVSTTITFRDLGDGKTEVVTHQHGLPPEYQSTQARAGWETSLDRFAAYVDALTSQGTR